MRVSALSEQKLPVKLVQIRLDQIEPDIAGEFGAWVARLRHASRSTPFLKPDGLSRLQLAQPLLVSLKSSSNVPLKDRTYRLEAGLRTYQLLLEQLPRKQKVWGLCVLPRQEEERLKIIAFDVIVAKLIQRPDGNDLAILAAALLDDRKLREAVGTYISAGSDAEIADALGLSRSTMHRQLRALRKQLSDQAETKGEKVSLEIDIDKEDLDD